MNIILASAEMTPFAKAGGLADVAHYLPSEWRKYGQNAISILPKYSMIDVDKYGFEPTDLVLYIPMAGWTEFARLWMGFIPGTKAPVYLIENNDYFNRPGIYGDPDEYLDNDRRFIFFSRAVFEAAKALNFSPDILHAHDYHAAFTQAFLKSHYRFDSRFSQTAGVFTIHNLAYQGWFDPARALSFAQYGLGEFYRGSWFEHNGAVNAMKTGIMFSDKITTVSPTYSREIRSPGLSEGMHDPLNLRASDLIGILNGVDYEVWNPEKDKTICCNYDRGSLLLKKDNKVALLKEFGLSDDDDFEKPVIGMVTRLVEQKGIDILLHDLERHLADGDFRLVLLGSGEKRYEDSMNYFAWKYPKNALIYLGYDEEKARKIIAGSDFFLIPSRFEPCGLTQMYAMKYGTIPIVRSTGGLADTVSEYVPETGKGTGFVFWRYDADDMSYAIRRAMTIFQKDPHWYLIRKNAMKQDFSSKKSAMHYLEVFRWALSKVRG